MLTGKIGETDWTIGFEGIPAGWAVVLLAAATGATIYSYRQVAEVTKMRRHMMTAARIAVAAILLMLLTRPVLHLTLKQAAREKLMILVDNSESMAFVDKRDRSEDLQRAAIAIGQLDPTGGLAQALSKEIPSQLPRWDLLRQLSANPKLNLWPELSELADLELYSFGRDLRRVRTFEPGSKLTAGAAADLFSQTNPTEPSTFIGGSLLSAVQDQSIDSAAGILLITDGQSNAGHSPIEAARTLRDKGIPLYVYGIGVASPPDIQITEIENQRLAFVDERLQVKARVKATGFKGKAIALQLTSDGQQVDEQNLDIGDDGEYTVTFSYAPEETGKFKLQVSASVLPEEINQANNYAEAEVQITDDKFQVLFIEQEPRWDFRYLLAYLQRDRRLAVRCVMIDGEPGLDQLPESPFLPELPSTRDTFFESQVLILGDVNPESLGEERMQTIRDWVEAGGGIIFLAGPRNNPLNYTGTPLEALLPVVPDTSANPDEAMARSSELFKLELTRTGETSPYLQMDRDPERNREIWDNFPGVRWTAPAARAKPGAEVLLTDPRPERLGRTGAQPVFAMQRYGAGTCVYLGTDETWRWRSRTGEKYYSILWGQIMQSLALQLMEGGSSRTQLKSDQPQYITGSRVVISGRAYTETFEPLVAPSLEGVLRRTDSSSPSHPITLQAEPGGAAFRAEFVAQDPGEYEFSPAQDPEAVVRFRIVAPQQEKNQTALNETLLRAMASAADGHYLREEDLHRLPGLLRQKQTFTASFQKVELYRSPLWLIPLIGLISTEWLLRRLSHLK